MYQYKIDLIKILLLVVRKFKIVISINSSTLLLDVKSLFGDVLSEDILICLGNQYVNLIFLIVKVKYFIKLTI